MTQSQTQLLRGFGPTEGSPPVAPTLAVEVADGVLIATVGGDAVVQHTLYGTTGTTGSAWVALGSRFGNGQIIIEDLSPGVYWLFVVSSKDSLNSLPSVIHTALIRVAEDPISLVYNALWSFLESDSEFGELVAPGCRIKFSGEDRSPIKEEATTADYPEVRIVSLSSNPHVNRTSNGSSLIKTFVVQVLSGDQRLTEVQYPMEWLIYRIMSKCVFNLSSLKWNDKPFVKNIKPANVQDSFGRAINVESAIRGWVSVWSVEVEMWFNTGDL